MDAHNDLAHHLMGRWHFEMAQINFVLRQVRQRQLESTHTAPCIAPCTYALLTQLMQHNILWWQNVWDWKWLCRMAAARGNQVHMELLVWLWSVSCRHGREP
jgi:hypothetical protein